MSARELVIERIKNGQCPICMGDKMDAPVLVSDPVFGEVLVCNTHVVQGTSALREKEE